MAETTQWRILQQLPALHSQIVDRLAKDSEFRSLCQDYRDCSNALKRFQHEAEILPDRILEYKRLLATLESEIRDILLNRETEESK